MKYAARVAVSVLVSVAIFAAPSSFGEVWRNHFDADGPSRAPAFFDFQVLGLPGKANWMVVSDQNPPSAPNQLTQIIRNRPEGSIAAALRRNVTLQDGRISVDLKKVPARAGLILREASEKDFLALLVNTESGEARLTAYRDGKPAELAQGKAEIDRDWGILVVSLAGPDLSVTWNEKPIFRARDPKPASGRVGLATEGAGMASFDEFVIETPEPMPAK